MEHKTSLSPILPSIPDGFSDDQKRYLEDLSRLLEDMHRHTYGDDETLATRAEVINTRIRLGSRRQVVLSGRMDDSNPPTGRATFLTYSGNAVSIDADDDNPLVLGFACGFDEYGANDIVKRITEEVAPSEWTNLEYGVHFLYVDVEEDGSLSYGKTRICPYYGQVYSKHTIDTPLEVAFADFEGTDAATTYRDNHGWEYYLQTNCSISNVKKKFGLTSLRCNGGSAYVPSPWVTRYPQAWTIDFFFNPDNLSATRALLGRSSYSFGSPVINITITTGVLTVYLSGNGTSWSIGTFNTSSGATADYWNHFALVFTGAKYLGFLNGAKEIDQSSTTNIYEWSKGYVEVGGNYSATDFVGYIDQFRFRPWAVWTDAFTVPTDADTPSEDCWFDLTNMVMKVGYRDNWTTKTRLFVGEVQSNGSAVTSLCPYAPNGVYVVTSYELAVNDILVEHGIGCPQYSMLVQSKLSHAQDWSMQDYDSAYGYARVNYGRRHSWALPVTYLGHANTHGVYAFPAASYGTANVKIIVSRDW